MINHVARVAWVSSFEPEWIASNKLGKVAKKLKFSMMLSFSQLKKWLGQSSF